MKTSAFASRAILLSVLAVGLVGIVALSLRRVKPLAPAVAAEPLPAISGKDAFTATSKSADDRPSGLIPREPFLVDPGTPSGKAAHRVHWSDFSRDELQSVVDELAAHGDYSGVKAFLLELGQADSRARLLMRFVKARAAVEPAVVARWISALPPDFEREEVLAEASRIWSEKDPQSAGNFALLLPPGELRRVALTSALSAWINEDVHAAAHWLGQQPPSSEKDESIATVARLPVLLKRDPEVALNWAESIFNPELRKQAVATALGVWLPQNRAAAIHYLETTSALDGPQRAAIMEDLGIPE